MRKSLSIYDSKTLSELDISYGEVVAFDNADLELPSPFIVAIAQNLTKISHDQFFSKRLGLGMVFWPKGEEPEYWSFNAKGDIMQLWPLSSGDLRSRNYDIFNPKGTYLVEKAYSGKEDVLSALENTTGFKPYASRLIMERGKFGRAFEILGLESILPNQLRIRR
ncbi:MAG: hypothetical protein WAU65_02290 [Candidatus Nanoarchaeia archaeon]